MNDNKKTARIILEIEWTSVESTLDLPSQWDWKRIKAPMSLDKVKYIGIQDTYNKPEKSENWMGN